MLLEASSQRRHASWPGHSRQWFATSLRGPDSVHGCGHVHDDRSAAIARRILEGNLPIVDPLILCRGIQLHRRSDGQRGFGRCLASGQTGI
jgi:hypothetical protein